MKKLLSFLFITCTYIAAAQEIKTSKDFKISNSPAYDVIDGEKHYFSFNDNSIVAVKFSKKEMHVQRFEGSKIALKSRKDYPTIPSDATISKILGFNGNILVFYEQYDKSNKSEQLFAFEIDSKTLKVGKTQKLLSTKRKVRGGGGLFKASSNKKFNVSSNYDKNVLMVSYSLIPEIKSDKKSKEEIGFHVFDQSLKKVWDKELTMPETEKILDINDACIDKNFNVHFLTKLYHDETRKEQTKDGKLNHHWEIFNIGESISGIERTKIGLKKGKILRTLSFFEGQDNNIVIAGYYADNAKSALSGSYIIQLDNLAEESDAVTAAFDVKEFKKYIKPRQQKKADKKSANDEINIADLKLRQIILFSDGSITTAGEVYRVSTTTSSKGQTTTTYESADIYAMNFDKDGNLNWFRKIPKHQMAIEQSMGTGLVSFSLKSGKSELGFRLITNGNDHYFVFLDHEKNIGLDANSRPYTHICGRGGFLTSYKIDQSGKITQHSLLNLKDYNGQKLHQFEPRRIIGTTNGFAVEFYIKKKQDMMVQVDFTESKNNSNSNSKKTAKK